MIVAGNDRGRLPRRRSAPRARRLLLASLLVTGALAIGMFTSLATAAKPVVSVVGGNIKQTLAVSPNWSGYVAMSPKGKQIHYTSVTATWTVLKAVCVLKGKRARTYSTAWVGLGGYAYEKQEEVGTDSNCNATGKGEYFAWFEVVPYLSYPVDIKDKLHAGDVVTGLVKVLKKAGRVELQLQNHTAGWTYTTKISWPQPDETSADFVVSAPAVCVYYTCSQASLSNFRAVGMHGISIVGNGKTGTLRTPGFAVTGVKLVPGKLKVPTLNPDARTNKVGQAKSPAGATPGPVSADGKSFQIKWVKVAGKAT